MDIFILCGRVAFLSNQSSVIRFEYFQTMGIVRITDRKGCLIPVVSGIITRSFSDNNRGNPRTSANSLFRYAFYLYPPSTEQKADDGVRQNTLEQSHRGPEQSTSRYPEFETRWIIKKPPLGVDLIPEVDGAQDDSFRVPVESGRCIRFKYNVERS